MNKMLLIAMALAAASFLGGCLAVHEEHHAVRHPHVIYGPPHHVVRVVPVPPPHHHGHGHSRHRW